MDAEAVLNKISKQFRIRYAAMELIPTTTRGNAMRLCFLTSMNHEKAARNKKHTPPLKSVHEGVQIRFTIGQIPVKWKSRPADMNMTAAVRNLRSGTFGSDAINHRPAASPSSI